MSRGLPRGSSLNSVCPYISRPQDLIGRDATNEQDARELYDKLRMVVVPMFYRDRERWIDVMRQTIAFNASFFNTHRMVQQYAALAYV